MTTNLITALWINRAVASCSLSASDALIGIDFDNDLFKQITYQTLLCVNICG